MNLTIRAEDIMTPRRLLKHATNDEEAEKLARDGRFDSVPFLTGSGLVREFWSRAASRRLPITPRHRTAHDAPVERLLRVLGKHIVQFVFYRSEMVGLIDASDLNKPRASLAWLEPMLELERSILDVVRERKIEDKDQEKALGVAAKKTLSRQRKAQKHDLMLPLLEYAQFPDLLLASRSLMIIHLSDDEIDQLNTVRVRAAHAGGSVIQDRSDCEQLKQTLELARRVALSVSGRRGYLAHPR